MARNEKERLLRDQKSSKNKLAPILCSAVVVILTLLLSTALLYWFFKHTTSVNASLSSNSSSSPALNLTKVGHPKNLSDVIEQDEKNKKNNKNKQTKTSGEEELNNIKEEVENTHSFTYVYVIKVNETLTANQACAVESVLRLFPDKKIFLIDFSKPNKTIVPFGAEPNYVEYLHYLYKDRMDVIFANKSTFFDNTPVQHYAPGSDQFEFLALLVTAYKYGGFVISTSMVMTSRDLLECLPEDTIVEPFAIIASKKFDQYLLHLLETFGSCGSSHQGGLEAMLEKTAETYSTSGGHSGKLEDQEVCNVPTQYCTFLRSRPFCDTDVRLISYLSSYCKQVIQAFLGIKINKLEVEEETVEMKKLVQQNKKNCSSISSTPKDSGC